MLMLPCVLLHMFRFLFANMKYKHTFDITDFGLPNLRRPFDNFLGKSEHTPTLQHALRKTNYLP